MGVKYITQSEDAAVENPQYMGNCWFVSAVDYVETADEELAALPALAPRSKAITRKSNEAYFNGWQNTQAPGDYIQLMSYHPEKMVYESQTTNDRFAVFSEIYYPPSKGWKVFIDGEPVPGFVKVNYLLRGLHVPPGKHTIEMKFEPRSFYIGETVSLISSLLIFLGLGLGVYFAVARSKKKEEPNTDYLDDIPVSKAETIVKEDVAEEKAKEEKPKSKKKKK
jgi:hypothetical protein